MLMNLMREIKTVAISTALLGVTALGTSYFFYPIWQAEAEITHPTVSELGNYYGLFSMYALMKGDNLEENAAVRSAYQGFTAQLSAYDNLKDFWSNSEYYKQNITGDNHEDNALLNKLINNVHFETLNEERGIVRLLSENPKQAEALLSSLLNDINVRTRTAMYDELIVKWKNLFSQVKMAAQLNVGRIKLGNSVDNQDWQGKLNMMKSVSPLDEQFHAFHLIKSPIKQPYWRKTWGILGGGVGFLLGLGYVIARRFQNKKVPHQTAQRKTD